MWARTAVLAERSARVERRSVEGDMAGVRGGKAATCDDWRGGRGREDEVRGQNEDENCCQG